MWSPPIYVQLRYEEERKNPMDENDERQMQEVLEPEENELFILVPEFLKFLHELQIKNQSKFDTYLTQDVREIFNDIKKYISTHTLEQ